MKLNVYDIQGSEVGKLDLDAELWEGHVNVAVISQAIAMYRENQAQRSANTQKRGEVSGGGKKPWKQKHTGRARAGSNRSPLWRSGGVTFGPKPRDTHYRLPQNIRRRALQETLRGKLAGEELVVLDSMNAETPKTKTFAGLAQAFSVEKKSVIILDQANDSLVLSLRNLKYFSLKDSQNVNAMDVVNAQKVIITKEAFKKLEERVKGADATSN